MDYNRFQALAAAAAPCILVGAEATDASLLVAAALAACPLAAMVGRLVKRDPHEALVRRIERQMRAHRRSCRWDRLRGGQRRSGSTRFEP